MFRGSSCYCGVCCVVVIASAWLLFRCVFLCGVYYVVIVSICFVLFVFVCCGSFYVVLCLCVSHSV